MYAQFFGNFLLSRGVVTRGQLISALEKKSSMHIRLGTLAIHAGYMSAGEVDEVPHKARHGRRTDNEAQRKHINGVRTNRKLH